MPEDHPLWFCPPEPPVFEQVTRLAQVHSSIRAGRAAEVAALTFHQSTAADTMEEEGWTFSLAEQVADQSGEALRVRQALNTHLPLRLLNSANLGTSCVSERDLTC